MPIKTFPFDVAATLDSEGRIAAYINAALETTMRRTFLTLSARSPERAG